MSSSQTTNSSSSSQPGFAPQVGDLTTAFNDANGALSQAQGAKAPTNFTAQFTPDQLNTFRQMLGYANGTSTTGQQTAGSTNMINGTNATTGALSGLDAFNPAATNNAPSLIAAATQYMNGQNIPAEVKQAMQTADQTANQVTLPGITQNANITGNADSSRTGIAQGLVQQGLAENAANMSGALSSQAFQNGLQLAENQATGNNTAALTALTHEGLIGNAATNTGSNAFGNAINDQGALFNMGATGGAGQQAADQANLTNQAQQFEAQTNSPFAALSNYMSIIGNRNWGTNNTGTSTTETSPSAFQVIGGLLGAGGTMADGLGKMGVTGSGLMSGIGALFGL